MTTYADLQAQIKELQAQAEAARKAEFTAAIAEITSRMAELGITTADLTGSVAKTRRSTGAVAAKYRDPQSGKTWSGRGRAPAWLVEAEGQGRSRQEFSV